jgi:NADP-dependent 3-hydroxy acid dehydrogenase YdfG
VRQYFRPAGLSRNVEEVRRRTITDGGRAHTAVIDAVDDAAVDEDIDGIAKQGGNIDILFNAVGPLADEYGNGKTL